MKLRVISLILCFVVPITMFAADSEYKVKYDGGSFSNLKAGSGLQMSVGQKDIKFSKDVARKLRPSLHRRSLRSVTAKTFTDAWAAR